LERGQLIEFFQNFHFCTFKTHKRKNLPFVPYYRLLAI